MAKYRDTVSGSEYKSRLACAWAIYKGFATSSHDEYEKGHGVPIYTKIIFGAVLTIASPVWFPMTMFEPFPYQKPGRIKRIS